MRKQRSRIVSVSLLLSLSLILYLLHLPLVKAADTSGQITWGSPLTINQYIVVGSNTEIPKGHYCYAFQQQYGTDKQVTYDAWQRIISGDLTDAKNTIEIQVPGSQVEWIRVSWTKAELHTGTAYDSDGNPITIRYYVVSGMMIEAIVKNVNAGLTAAVIFAIFVGIAILALVIAIIVWGSLVVWDVLDAAKKLGPAATITVGMLMLIILLVAVLAVLGVGFSYSGKKRSVSINKSRASLTY